MMLLGALAGLCALPVAASAEDKIYPPGTDCANQPTIAERLLCGRQEFRRQSGTSVEQPMEVPPSQQDRSKAFQEPTPAPTALTPITEQQRTSSPNH
jgi:hypothetical protein